VKWIIDDGVRASEVILRVIVPAALPGIVSGALICFVFCFDEVVLTVFLTGLRTTLLPKVIWDGVQDDMKPVIAAACTSLMAVVGLMLTLQLVFGWLRARRTFMRAA
jgi:putative spermidine/putrescine transport system permease protein